MREPLEKRAPRETLKRRQLEIRQCLAEHGLVRGPRRLSPDAAGEGSHCRRLSAALVSLGPVFSSFGIYLASRVDLLPARNCLELAVIPDRAEPTPIETVWELIRREIGCSPFEVYSAFEEEPFESRLMFQLHRAWLRNNDAVTVKVIRPEFEEQLALDEESLLLLKSALAGETWGDLPIESAISDFRRTLRRQINLLNEVEMMKTLANQVIDIGSLRVPIVHRKLCSPKVLTVERLTGSTLEDLLSPFDEAGPREYQTASRASTINGVDSRDLANQLCLLWLRLALQGQSFPVEPRADNILILPNNQIAFIGGTFATLPSEAKVNLLDYLIAASNQDPDRACSCLIKEMTKSGEAVGEEELRQRLRQVVPFRDGGWGESGDSDSLAEHLFLHWRLAVRQGYRPLLHLLNFFRGLFWIANSTRRPACGKDALLEALADLRLAAAMSQFREMMSLPEMTDSAHKYTSMMMEMPRKLDEALTLMAEGNALLRLEGAMTAERQRRKGSSAVVIALLLLLASVVLISHHVSSTVSGAWVDKVSAVAFLLIGALLLRAVTSHADK